MWGVEWPVLLAAVVTGVIAVSRVTRLIVDDTWPPVVWARGVWDRVWGQSPWVALIECPHCVAPYVAAADIGWAVWSGLNNWWWAVNGWLAVSYLASMLNVRDIPVDMREP